MKLRIGGVPEHFNYLWHMSSTREAFRNAGFYYEWTDYPGGSAAMAAALESGEIDIAIMLSEGAIAAIESGKPLCIEFPFVTSPLNWGIFTGAQQTDLPKLSEAIFAISRRHSGSHLMALFLAQKEGQALTVNNFLVTQDLAGAKAALQSGQAHYFLWEQYMTRPLVREGIFRQVGNLVAPWPAFVFARKRDMKNFEKDAFLQALNNSIASFILWPREEIVDWLREKFHISEEDAVQWLAEVKYYNGNDWWQESILAAAMIMQAKGIIGRVPGLKELIAPGYL